MAGRPTKMTKETLEILDDAWIANATIEEAALLADIDPGTIYNYKKENPEYLKRIERLKGLTSLNAKKNINKGIAAGDEGLSKWHLERRDPDYKPKSKQELSGTVKMDGATALINALTGKRRGKCGGGKPEDSK